MILSCCRRKPPTMPLSLFRRVSIISVLVFMLGFCSADPFCNVRIYGIPNYGDCLSALQTMPFATSPRQDFNSRSFELWSEPQFLRPPFAPIFNRYGPLPINQLPKIWRVRTSTPPSCRICVVSKPLLVHHGCHPLTRGFSGTCRLAIMSYGRQDGSVLNGMFSTSWRTVLKQMQALFVCGRRPSGLSPSGGQVAFIST